MEDAAEGRKGKGMSKFGSFGYIDPRPRERRHEEAEKWWEAHRGRIKELLVEGKTQEQIGEEIGRSQNDVSRWIRNLGIKR